jgi:glycosyltransferase involved in cell wall biosynthesis
MVMPIRLLYLTAETCPTFRVDVDVLFGKYLPKFGVYSDIIAGRALGQTRAVEWGGGSVFLCSMTGSKAKKHIKILLHGIYQLFRANNTRYQAIQIRDLPLLAVFGLLAAKHKRLPFYYWMSYPIPEGQIALARERGLSSGWLKYLLTWLRGQIGCLLLYYVILPRADHIFVQSDRMKFNMIKRGILPEKMTSVPMGIDLDVAQPEKIPPSEDPRLSGRRVLVYLGTLDRPRRIEVLFEMLAQIREKVPEVLLVIVGDTEDNQHREWLRCRAASAGVADDVLWTGWLPTKEGWRYVRAAEIGLSPFPRGFLLDSASPTKVSEYLALGALVVCNDNPDQSEVINTSRAGRCVIYTAQNFADAVCELLALDLKALSSLITSGQSYVAEKRDYQILAKALSLQYESILFK